MIKHGIQQRQVHVGSLPSMRRDLLDGSEKSSLCDRSSLRWNLNAKENMFRFTISQLIPPELQRIIYMESFPAIFARKKFPHGKCTYNRSSLCGQRTYYGVGSWIERNPDIAQSVRVVHLVRDPRAIYSSRRGLRWCTNYKPCDSAAALCDQMRSDLDAFRELTRRLQINRTYQIRFEDLAADPLNETMRVFGSLGLNYAPSVSKYIETHTVAAAAEMRDAHSTKRNSKTVVHMWKTKLSMQKIREIETTCGDVLQRLGYKSVPK
ncbi:carbohydrate sulfotransferase 4-like isoform X5 [Dermacentor variabilis]|uniref:carbohydrate sulfotransferase 4-like isoform X5 n=2 Tax=Dermacentor variabilis TaxID=34621 RepID=UPI003F5C9418